MGVWSLYCCIFNIIWNSHYGITFNLVKLNYLIEKRKLPIKEHKIFKCEECDITYTQDKDLQLHINGMHRDEKNFKCTQCAHTTAWPADLARHVASKHTDGAKKYKCNRDLCTAAFSRSDKLKNHIREKHDNIKYECPSCDKSYTRNPKLQAHIKLHHSDEILIE